MLENGRKTIKKKCFGEIQQSKEPYLPYLILHKVKPNVHDYILEYRILVLKDSFVSGVVNVLMILSYIY